MAYVYILKCKNGRFYIGSTGNLERRLVEHNSGKTKSLEFLGPLELVFSQKYNLLTEARKVELKLKQFKNKKIIEQIISDKIIKLGS